MPDAVTLSRDNPDQQVSLEMIRSQNAGLTVDRPPEQILEEAHRAAKALKGVLDAKTDKVMMNNEQYLEFEDWQTIAHFYGTTCKEDGDPEPVFFGEVKGFKASAVAIRNGTAVSRATAYCLSDEPKWHSRPKYEWAYICKDGTISVEDPGKDNIIWEKNPRTGKNRPKKSRTLIGEEPVPFFQLASMAQTRANAKVLRNVFAWVVVLAGYKPNPAEELGEDTTKERQTDEGESEQEKQNARTAQEVNALIAELESIGVTRAQISVKFRHDPAALSPAEAAFIRDAITSIKAGNATWQDLKFTPAQPAQAAPEAPKHKNGKASTPPAETKPNPASASSEATTLWSNPEPPAPETKVPTIGGTFFVSMFANMVKAEGWTSLDEINMVLLKEFNIVGVDNIPQNDVQFKTIVQYFKDHKPPEKK